MGLLILIWLPFAVLVVGYLCSWPRRASFAQLVCFDGPVLALLAIYPYLMYFHPEYFAVSDSDLLETRMWLPFTVPLVTTVVSIPIMLLAFLIRYFVFRPRGDANHLTNR